MTPLYSQLKVGDNPTSIDAKAVLEMESKNKGLLIPRMTAAQKNAIGASLAQKGLLIYQTDSTEGFQYFDGVRWQQIGSMNLAAPTALIGLAPQPGSASTAMRSDAAPALSQAIVPNWTGVHTFQSGLVIGGNMSLTGAGSQIRLNGSAGNAGQVLMSQGNTNTPVWSDIPTAVQVKAKNRSVLLSNVDSFDIAVPSLDIDDGISIAMEADAAPKPMPTMYFVRDIVNARIRVYFSAGFSGFITWLIIQ